jgi:uncharacterized protein (TIGR02391 family)
LLEGLMNYSESLKQGLPTATEVRALPVEELAWLVLHHLKSSVDKKGILDKSAYVGVASAYGHDDEDVAQIVMEAWEFLEHQGLLVHRAGYSGAYDPQRYRISRKGIELATHDAWNAFVRGSRLPERLLHPRLMSTAYTNYIRGAYDSAVREAFHAVEVAVREKGGLPKELIGDALMGEAFKVGGPLRDSGLHKTEADGVALIFKGAIALWRNPSAHRQLDLDDAEAGQLLIVASRLLSIVNAD